ncbi:MAG: antitoxin family protein [Pirellulaceae bacterium]
MTTQFMAIVEDGRLRPTVPVELTEGTAVEVFIVARDAAPQTGSPADILAGIAALSAEAVDPATSIRHDDVLYGREAQP